MAHAEADSANRLNAARTIKCFARHPFEFLFKGNVFFIATPMRDDLFLSNWFNPILIAMFAGKNCT